MYHNGRLFYLYSTRPNKATQAVGIGKFDVEIPVGSKFSINIYSFISGKSITGRQDG